MSLVRLEEPAPGVRLLRLDDPGRRNAISPALRDDLCAAVDAVAADGDARALVLTGNGTAFCAGADLTATFGDPGLPVHVLRDRLRATYDSFLRVRRLPIPTIAAVQGAAVGAGANLALCCDLRIAGPRARFGITFTRLGLHPGGGCTAFLVDALGPQRALAVLLDGATLSAAEAEAAGLVLAGRRRPARCRARHRHPVRRARSGARRGCQTDRRDRRGRGVRRGARFRGVGTGVLGHETRCRHGDRGFAESHLIDFGVEFETCFRRQIR
ncbi:enoyl-CoA hydratase-related protein [Actinophytocola algeriensis]|uniref:Enoyl-CoA hydratase/carnithine racemase n=1 Tax=Actinophytocola algeriensis TaxID=1768010 RepID=A0A7W7VHX6_9PSEU|nr:enoyl-CoA hydratase-related protein [Actinophytocola algeriensis]MBB4910891.1 enoyl-CoA hydratase/carnithine racemase [Actinophytocola algeriensis]MBE1473884.1 enoyl-CoA hydratase/carnithine racemase [Actinophytocola algeriensis]